MDDTKNQKASSIEASLEAAASSLGELKKELAGEAKTLPASARHLQQRVESLQEEVSSVSDKMLAYKLHRLASSKMLASVSELTQDKTSAVDGRVNSSAIPSPSVKPGVKSKKAIEPYQSSTFQCKSDLDKCLVGASNAMDMALCYALFIRCAVKG